MTRPATSVIIVSWNTRDRTLECVRALPSGFFGGSISYEVIVVDNGSRDGTVEALRRETNIRVIFNSDNKGFAKAVNQAYELARGEFMLLLNSDAYVHRGSLTQLHRFLEEHPSAAGVAPLFLNPDGTRQQHYYRLPTFLMTLANASLLLRRLPYFRDLVGRYRMTDTAFGEPGKIDQPSASCLLLRRMYLSPTCLLDERFPIFYNDVVLAHEIANRGGALWIDPRAVVTHEHGESVRGLGSTLRRQHLGSTIRYLRLRQPTWKVALFQAVIFLEGIGRYCVHPRRALSPRTLMRALRGDLGPLPSHRASH